jgi:hypothetical protein
MHRDDFALDSCIVFGRRSAYDAALFCASVLANDLIAAVCDEEVALQSAP